MGVYTVTIQNATGTDVISLSDGTTYATLEVGLGRGPKGDGFTGGSYAPSTGIVTFTSDDGIGFSTSDIRGDLSSPGPIGNSSPSTITGTTITGTSFVSSGNMTFGDNDKAIFGDGSDLTVDHTGSSGRVLNGTGNLLIRSTETDSDVRIQGDDQNGSYAEYFQANGGTGAAELFFAASGSSSVKLATTSTGADITGTLTSDGLTVDGNVSIGHGSPTATLDVRRGDASGKIAEFHTSTGFGIELGSSQSEAYIQAGSNQALLFNTNVSNERMRIDSSGRLLVAKTTTAFGTVGHTIWNDGSHDLTASAIPPIQANRLTSDGDIIAFYKTSSKVGSIGNSGTNFIIQQSNSSGVVQIKNHDSTEDIEFGQDYFRIKQGGSERMRIDSSGRLLLGTTTEGHADGDNFTISGSGNTGMTIRSTNSQKSTIYFSDSTSGAGEYAGYIHYDHSGNNLNIGVNENERLRIDSSGNLIKTGGGLISSNGTGDTLVISGSNAVNTGGNITLEGNTASDVSQIKFKNGSTEVMRVAGGNVGIGTSSPAHPLHVNSGGANNVATFESTDATARIAFVDSNQTQGVFVGAKGDDFYIQAGGSERVRLDDTGNLYFGTNGAEPSASQTGVRIASTDNENFWKSSTPRTSAYDQLAFFNGNGLVGTITTSGSATAYNTSSDYRLKTDAQPMTGASERVQALNPVNFEWVADGTRVDGFLAHEAQVVVPEAVTGTKDAVDANGNPEYQSIDQSKIVPLLTAALQEALTEITALKARVTTLEGA